MGLHCCVVQLLGLRRRAYHRTSRFDQAIRRSLMSRTASQTGKQITPERIMQFAWGYSIPLIIEAAICFYIFFFFIRNMMHLFREIAKSNKANEYPYNTDCNIYKKRHAPSISSSYRHNDNRCNSRTYLRTNTHPC